MARERIIGHVRQQSNAGWFVGGVCVSIDNMEPWDNDSGYYPSEEWLKEEYPTSISMEEAIERARRNRWINW